MLNKVGQNIFTPSAAPFEPTEKPCFAPLNIPSHLSTLSGSGQRGCLSSIKNFFINIFHALYNWFFPVKKKEIASINCQSLEDIHFRCFDIINFACLAKHTGRKVEATFDYVKGHFEELPEAFQNVLREHYFKIKKVYPKNNKELISFFQLRSFNSPLFDRPYKRENVFASFLQETELGALARVYIGKELITLLEQIRQEVSANRKVKHDVYMEVLQAAGRAFKPHDFSKKALKANFKEKIEVVKSMVAESEEYLTSQQSKSI